MALGAKRHLLLAALLALVPVIPGTFAEIKRDNDLRTAMINHVDDSEDGNPLYGLIALLVFPGAIVADPITKLMNSLDVHAYPWFWIYCEIAFTSWAVYFIAIFLILRWRESRRTDSANLAV